MFDLGWSELLLIGVVALIVVGPKDLPGLFRTAGQFMGKARGMAREFSRAMEAAADEAGVKEVQQTLKAAANPKAFGLDKLREATDVTGRTKPGGATEKLSKERTEAKEKILAAGAKAAEARRSRPAASPGAARPSADATAPAAATATADPAAPASATTAGAASASEGAAIPDPAAPKPAGEP